MAVAIKKTDNPNITMPYDPDDTFIKVDTFICEDNYKEIYRN